MTRIKKFAVCIAAAALAAFTAFSLTGCGEQVAATWAHGQILEEEITTAATNTMDSYEDSTTGEIDVDSWRSYIQDKSYDTDAADTTDSDDESAETGTVAEYREYLINQKIRQAVIDYEVEQQGIEVSDDEVQAEVDSEATLYEQYYGGGFAGTFESILNRYFGMTMEEFKEEVKENLAQQKLEEKVLGISDEDDEATESTSGDEATESTSGDEATESTSGDSDEATESTSGDAEDADESTDSTEDTEDQWDAYVDNLVAQANVQINECPSNLSYDPDVVEQEQASEATSGTEEATSGTTDATSGTDSDDTDATSEDSSSKKATTSEKSSKKSSK